MIPQRLENGMISYNKDKPLIGFIFLAKQTSGPPVFHS
jgi:hypothetical protein